jgi:hypothetical protein
MGQNSEVFPFTFHFLDKMLASIKSKGYRPLRLYEYDSEPFFKFNFFLRIDVDFMPEKIPVILDLLEKNDVKATFFFRVFSPSYNPSSFAMRRLIQRIQSDSHEIGLHHESVDASHILNISPLKAFQEQKKLLELITEAPILGAASHGGLTGLNNQDLFESHTCEELGIKYEAYDRNAGLFSNSRYVSDSQWFQWKAYENGKIMPGDIRTPEKHLTDSPQNLYVLIHPDTFYSSYPFENFKIGN